MFLSAGREMKFSWPTRSVGYWLSIGLLVVAACSKNALAQLPKPPTTADQPTQSEEAKVPQIPWAAPRLAALLSVSSPLLMTRTTRSQDSIWIRVRATKIPLHWQNNSSSYWIGDCRLS